MRSMILYLLFLYSFSSVALATPVTLYMRGSYVSDKGIDEFVAVLNTSDKTALSATISIFYEDNNFAKFTREFPAKRRDGFSLNTLKNIGFSTVIESSEKYYSLL
ncbi:MAG: hypothetical protein R3E08_14875 [Thiotrichaceae bacterium]